MKDQKAPEESLPEKIVQETEIPKSMKSHWRYSLISSLVLGGLFIYLFLWKLPGASYFIFYVVALLCAVLPGLIWERERISKTKLLSWFAVGIGILLSAVFLYRLDPSAIVFGMLTLPVYYAMVSASIYNPGIVKKLGMISYLALPLILFVSWFGDAFNFLKGFRLSSVKSPHAKSVIKRVLIGIVIAIPFLLAFSLLLGSADLVFAQLVQDWLEYVFGGWFTLMNLTKLFVGILAAIYFAVFNYSLLNPKSTLEQLLKSYENGSQIELKKNWDPLIASVVLILVNLLFVVFVAVQFVYLFAGESNINGGENGFTYAQYARRGFKELLVLSILVYSMGLILSFKINAKSMVQKVLFRVNYVFLIVLTLIINVSAQMRLGMMEDVYGYTGVRLTGHLVMTVIAVLLTVLAVFFFTKQTTKWVGKATAVVFGVTFMILLIVPDDYVVSKLNYERFESTGKIDLPYFLGQSDEAVPVIIDLAENDKTSKTAQFIIKANLAKRLKVMEEKRQSWQSYNIWNEYNKEAITEFLGGDNEKSRERSQGFWEDEASDTLAEFLENYEKTIKSGDYKKAHEEFWTSGSEFSDDEDLDRIQVTKYDSKDTPVVDDWSIMDVSYGSLAGDRGFDYWSGMYIYIDMEYDYAERFWDNQSSCRSESIRVKLEDGNWKITYASELPLNKDADSEDEYYYGADVGIEDLFEDNGYDYCNN